MQTRRYDIYALVHKGLRFNLSQTLIELGKLDVSEPGGISKSLQAVRDLLLLCHEHLAHENDYVHTAMNARQPGSAAVCQQHHAEHGHAIEVLAALALQLERAESLAERQLLTDDLYRELSVFVAENLAHMALEERDNNVVLWAHYTDQEIQAIESALVASLAPEVKALSARWMVPAISPAQRAEVLSGMRRAMPEPAFQGLLQGLRPLLSGSEWSKLQMALAL
jgi:hypothetical protein